jgi:NAD(P)-dependent dehydrogenase (short-subunit alcohol dehydrogenase family)
MMTIRTEPPVSRPLTGRVAVVTGAARGIGRAAAVALSEAGADVAGIDIAAQVSPILDFEPATAEDLAQTGRLVAAAGGRWMPRVADQRKIDQIRAAAEAVEREWGGADVVFANAGIQAFKPLLEMSDPDWHDQIENNLNGTANVLRSSRRCWSAAAAGGSSSPHRRRASTGRSSGRHTRRPSGGSSA